MARNRTQRDEDEDAREAELIAKRAAEQDELEALRFELEKAALSGAKALADKAALATTPEAAMDYAHAATALTSVASTLD